MVEMPAVIVLIACLATPVGEPTENDKMTGHEETEWVLSEGKKHCRRMEVQMGDPQYESGAADFQPFNQFRCNQAGVRMMTNFDVDQRMKKGKYRAWRFLCPTPKYNGNTGEITSYQIPEDCGDRATIECEGDMEI